MRTLDRLRTNVIDPRLQSVGLSVEWNSGVRVKGGQRHRISLVQVATNSAVLIVLLSQIRPLRLPKLLRQVLEDASVRKVSSVCVCARAYEQAHPSDYAVLQVGRRDTKGLLFFVYCTFFLSTAHCRWATRY